MLLYLSENEENPFQNEYKKEEDLQENGYHLMKQPSIFQPYVYIQLGTIEAHE